jgi:UDP-glucose:(heptosyl)LPS alpha-1,3-glucosyltransferase
MRIGLIRMRHTPFGGAETFMGRFMKELLKRGHTVEVFSREWELEREEDGVLVHRIKTFGPSFLKPLVFAWRAKKEVERAAPDIVVSLERTFCQDVYRAGDGVHREWLERRRAAGSFARRFLMRLNPLHPVLLYLERRLFTDERLKRIVANSNGVKRDIIRHYGLPEDKICVIYNGIDPATYEVNEAQDAVERAQVRSELGAGEGTTLLVFVGSGFERKGLIYAIRALALLKDDCDVRLVVVGKGNAERYRREAKRLGVGERVIFIGPVKGARKYYRAGDIFILPTVYEPFSNACLEAMASGLPVVTTKRNGASEIMTDGGDSVLLDDPADTNALARKIRPLLDAGFRKKAGILARATALNYTIERNVDGFLRVIEEVRKGAVRG